MDRNIETKPQILLIPEDLTLQIQGKCNSLHEARESGVEDVEVKAMQQLLEVLQRPGGLEALRKLNNTD